MEFDTSELEDEILYVLRKRLAVESVAATRSLRNLIVDGIGISCDRPPDEINQLMIHTIEESIRYHLPKDQSDLQDAIQLLAGLDPRTASWNIRREETKELEAEALNRIRMGKYPKWSNRRVEQVERSAMAPAVCTALVEMLSKTRPSKHRWDDCRLILRIYSDGDGNMLMRLQQSFRTVQTRLIFLVTDDGAIADGMCSKYPDVTDVFVPSSDVLADTVFSVSVVTSAGETELEVTEASSQDVESDLLVDIQKEGIDEVYVVNFPPECAAKDNEVRLTSTQKIELDERFCYWTAPRETLLRTVQLDYSGFPSRANYSFRLRPRLGFPVTVRHRASLQQFDIHVDAWISAGCGFEFLWRALDGSK